MPSMDGSTRQQLLRAQRVEITEYRIDHALAERASSDHNRGLQRRIGDDERRHRDVLAGHTGVAARPRSLLVAWYTLLARVLGVTFALRLMERGEEAAQVGYLELAHLEGVAQIGDEEHEHEQRLLGMLEDQRLEYAGSVVLGLNDALF